MLEAVCGFFDPLAMSFPLVARGFSFVTSGLELLHPIVSIGEVVNAMAISLID